MTKGLPLSVSATRAAQSQRHPLLQYLQTEQGLSWFLMVHHLWHPCFQHDS